MRIVRVERVSVVNCTGCGDKHDGRVVFEVGMDVTLLGGDAEFFKGLRAFICPNRDYLIVLYRDSDAVTEEIKVEKV